MNFKCKSMSNILCKYPHFHINQLSYYIIVLKVGCPRPIIWFKISYYTYMIYLSYTPACDVFVSQTYNLENLCRYRRTNFVLIALILELEWIDLISNLKIRTLSMSYVDCLRIMNILK